jgi:hypothetical protein
VKFEDDGKQEQKMRSLTKPCANATNKVAMLENRAKISSGINGYLASFFSL